MLATPGGAGSVPSGQYTGNGVDEILVRSGSFEWDTTLSDRGVAYHVGMASMGTASLRVSAAAFRC